MDARLREATSIELAAELNRLFNTLDLKTGTPESKLDGYVTACRGCSYHALKTTIDRITRGEIAGMSKKFCPTAPELGEAIRDYTQEIEKQIALAAERVQIADHRPIAVAPRLLDDRVKAARLKMEDEERALLFPVTTHAEWLSRRKEAPAGAIYSGILSAVYGPPGSLRQSLKQEKSSADVVW